MNFIAAHWQQICEVLFFGFVGTVLVACGLRDRFGSGPSYADAQGRENHKPETRS